MDTQPADGPTRLTAVVSGDVQGVGFRFTTMSFARSMQLVGFAENRPDGDVLVVVEGPQEDCAEVLAWLEGTGSRAVRRPGQVTFVDAMWGPAEGGFRSFTAH